MILKVEVKFVVELKYNPNSNEFKNALQKYNEDIQEASEDEFLENVAVSVVEYGVNTLIEGAGYLKNGEGECIDDELWCGIQVNYKEFPTAEIL